MKKLMLAAAIAAVLVGCSKKEEPTEAQLFGYKESDLEEVPPIYIVRGTVTNWVPARVIRVNEQYELTAAETNVVRALGLIESGSSFAEAPAGYAQREVEPWFTTWVKNDAVAFGQKGTAGFVAHFDPDTKAWSSGETFFSTYHPTPEKAREALKAMVAGLERECSPLKVYPFDDATVAEYRRLRVVCVVGARAAGDFACMVSVSDKNRAGCGECVPVAEQQEMLDGYLFSKAVQAWDAECARIGAANHEKVAKAAAARKLKLFGDEKAEWTRGGQGGYVAARFEALDWKKDDPRRATLLAERMKSAAADFGVTFGNVCTNAPAPEFAEYVASGTGALYDVNVVVRFIDPPAPPEKADGKDGEEPPPPDAKPVTVGVEAAERLQDGVKLPPYPQMPQR